MFWEGTERADLTTAKEIIDESPTSGYTYPPV
jgi:hypothetical protein